ncbi:sugar transferase [Shewanella chilikensis]|uniref:sugar transferase n=1 Tax=Shewanella chilikensis TaxID=558541 RepID=UPI003B66EFAA
MLKRTFDVVVSLVALLVLSPVLVVVAILVYLNLGSPIIFSQARPGLNSKVFNMLKFRSMLDAKDKHGNILNNNERLTSFGIKLRATSLDELPGLINVLKGDMSLVGPRPLLVEYLPLYSKEQAKRHNVKPGLTGWAQVNGRNAISWEQKFAYDVWYTENRTFWLDIKILLMTIKKVIIKENINFSESVTMEKFKGSK